MTPETFFENFGHLADAPNGVQKLRELILQLAVRGKLVPQDPSDEPAAKLLERIRAEKARLVKEKKIRKADPLPPVTTEEAPHELPQGWEWVRLSSIALCLQTGPFGSTLHKSDYVKNGIPVINPANIVSGTIFPSATMAIAETTRDRLANYCLQSDDIIIARRGEMGRCALVTAKEEGWLCGTGSVILRLSSLLFHRYFAKLISSEGIRRFLSEASVGTTMDNLNQRILLSMLIALPPLAEQRRIVAKVDQVMALCDELEARQQKSEQKLLRLNNAALDRLTNAGEADAFSTAWQLVRDSFDLLYTTPDTIAKLRQSILQLAVDGKLIGSDNRGHWKEGVLGDVVESSEAGWSPQCENRPRTGDEWGMLKVSAVSWDRFKPDENKALPSNLSARPQYEVKIGDFIISRANTEELVAKSVVVTDTPPRLSLSDKTVRLHFRADASPRFFCLVNNSPASRQYYAGVAGGTSSSMKNVTRQQILQLPVLIPPFVEQLKVVAKVDHLMALCDHLEGRLTKAQNEAERLMLASVQRVIAV